MAGDAELSRADAQSEEESKRDRQMIELLNELRVALPGVQILFAFLLTVPFTQRFPTLTPFERDIFYLTLLATAFSTACLITDLLFDGVRVWVYSAIVWAAIIGLWFVRPLYRRTERD